MLNIFWSKLKDWIQFLISKTIVIPFLLSCSLYLTVQTVSAQDAKNLESSLRTLRDEVLSYFTPVTGGITSVNGNSVKLNIGSKSSIKPGMRLYAFKKGASFIHPVTKESLGNIEIPIGSIEITSADADSSDGTIIKGKSDDFANALVKIPGTKIRLLFYQGNVDWFLGDAYYQELKESGRFELIDTGIETTDIAEIVTEAKKKGAEVVLVLDSAHSPNTAIESITITQKLIWVNDSKQFSENRVPVNVAYIKELKFKSLPLGTMEGEPLLSYQIPFGARRLSVGDLNGDGNPDILLASGDKIMVYNANVDLQHQWEFKIPSAGDIIWIDTIDKNKNKRDEILITSIHDNDIISFIYELENSTFVQLWKSKDVFIRRLDNGIIGQKYTRGEGYNGNVFFITQEIDGTYRFGENLKLPSGINIYDFQFVRSPDGKDGIIAWSEDGYLNLFNKDGIMIWAGKEAMGGFLFEYKKDSPTVMVDRGKWSVKDRLIMRNNEILAPKRYPLLTVAKGLGYKSSGIQGFWWNGLGVEESTILKDINGEILDYSLTGDKIIVLSKPLFGINVKKILKGENPLGIMLYIFSSKGR